MERKTPRLPKLNRFALVFLPKQALQADQGGVADPILEMKKKRKRLRNGAIRTHCELKRCWSGQVAKQQRTQ